MCLRAVEASEGSEIQTGELPVSSWNVEEAAAKGLSGRGGLEGAPGVNSFDGDA